MSNISGTETANNLFTSPGHDYGVHDKNFFTIEVPSYIGQCKGAQ